MVHVGRRGGSGRSGSGSRGRRCRVSGGQLLVVMVVMMVVQMMVMARGRGRDGAVPAARRIGCCRCSVIVRGRHVEQRLGVANKFVNVPFAWQTIKERQPSL